jgi:hypothetical protein
MNAIIKLDLSYPNHLFNTKEEWDYHVQNLGRYTETWDCPERFPCVAIKTYLEYKYSDGEKDYQHYYFFYDFTLEEDNGVD